MQQWLGNEMKPMDFGWENRDGKFCPNLGYAEICPPSIYWMLACNCKLDCSTGTCGCRRLGMSCTDACNCCDDQCKNSSEVSNNDVDDGSDMESVDEEDILEDSDEL